MDESRRLLPASSSDALPCHAAPQLWFSRRPADVEAAKHRCQPCPIRAACLAGALRRREPIGVWGGQLLEDGQVLPHLRPRGRPRRVPLPAATAS